MKNLVARLLALSCLLALVLLLQAPGEAHGSKAKKLLKRLKKLKKLKKYAWLLAAQQKRFYAIPFPMPLPIFVKRQQIYTQIPVIPRYVQQPQHYGGQPAAEESQAEMLSLGTGTTPSELHYAPDEQHSRPQHTQARRRKRPGAQHGWQLAAGSLPSSARYLQQLASLVGHAHSSSSASSDTQAQGGSGGGGVGTHRELLSKLLGGQAKVIAPSSLLASLKSSASQAQLQSGAAAQSPTQQGQSQESKSAVGHESNTSGESDLASRPNESSQSDSAKQTAADLADSKPAASQLAKPLRLRMRQLALLQQQQQQQQVALMPLNRLAALGLPVSPVAAAWAANQLRALGLDAQQQESSAEESAQEAQESQDTEQVAPAQTRPNLFGQHNQQQQLRARQREHLLRQREFQLQQVRQNELQAAGQLVLASVKQRRQHEQLRRLAMAAREHQEAQAAAQLAAAESRALLLRANHLGASPADQVRLAHLLRQRQLEHQSRSLLVS